MDADVWCAAQLLCRLHDNPELVALVRIHDMLCARDSVGAAAWKDILAAVRELRRTAPHEGECLN